MATPRTRNRPAQGGFTLLEVMVALTILGFIIVIAFGALRFGVRGWEASISRSGAADQVRSVRHFLYSQLSELAPVRLGRERRNRIAFQGEHDVLRLVAPLAGQRAGNGLQVLQFSVEDDGARKRLVLRYAPFEPGQSLLPHLTGGRGPAAGEAVLMQDMAHIEFAYFGAQRDGQAERWNSSWPDDAAVLPSLIRIRLDADGDPAWPDLLVPLYAEMSS